MKNFYIKSNGKFIPVEVKDVFSKDFEGKLVLMKVGTDANPVPNDELVDIQDKFSDPYILDMLDDTGFLITTFEVQVEVLSDLETLKDKKVTVQISRADLSKVDWLKTNVIKQLKREVKEVYMLPSPITLEEYQEVIQIKKRSDLRKKRRGR